VKIDNGMTVANPAIFISQTEITLCFFLFSFCIHELTTNMQAADCITHTRCVAAFHKLPSTYPSGHKWSAEDNKHNQPITKDILKGITQELTSKDNP